MNKDLQRTEHNAPTPGNQKTIGIDLGDRWSRYCILGGDGQIVEEDRIPTSTDALERAFKKMSATRVVVETGTHSGIKIPVSVKYIIIIIGIHFRHSITKTGSTE